MTRTGSLCSGYEGLGAAVMDVLGGDLAWVADNDPGASAILAYRFPRVPNLHDITAVDWAAVEPVDVLTAGFPCQDVSCAGGRAGLRAGNRTGVWAHVARAIDMLRPSLVVLENVRGLLSAGADSDLEWCPWCMGDADPESALRALGAVLGDLAGLGFDADWAVVSAADVGAPHRRERVFITAWPAADACGRELQRRGVGGVLGGTPSGEPGEGHQRQRAGDAARDGGPVAQDADRPASSERRQSAPGQAPRGWARPDSGRSGGASTDADTASIRHGDTGPQGERGLPSAAVPSAPADTDSNGLPRGPQRDSEPQGGRPGHEQRRVDPLRCVLDWGIYEPAVARWEHVTGRPAPRPTEPGRTGERLSPRFVEWLMGLPDGWVTDVPGLTRNAQLKALGNGVVPQQAAAALRLLLPAVAERAA